jgi:hypothetical protein
MEDAMSLNWDQLTSERLREAEVVKDFQRTMPAASIDVQVAAEDDSQSTRRIDIRVQWQQNANRSPLHLVAWRYRVPE